MRQNHTLQNVTVTPLPSFTLLSVLLYIMQWESCHYGCIRKVMPQPSPAGAYYLNAWKLSEACKKMDFHVSGGWCSIVWSASTNWKDLVLHFLSFHSSATCRLFSEGLFFSDLLALSSINSIIFLLLFIFEILLIHTSIRVRIYSWWRRVYTMELYYSM